MSKLTDKDIVEAFEAFFQLFERLDEGIKIVNRKVDLVGEAIGFKKDRKKKRKVKKCVDYLGSALCVRNIVTI